MIELLWIGIGIGIVITLKIAAHEHSLINKTSVTAVFLHLFSAIHRYRLSRFIYFEMRKAEIILK